MRDRASRENRARRSGSFATAGSSTLIATSRPSLVSRARLDRAHTALAERGQDLERAEARAGRERRRCQRGEILVRKPPRSARAAHSTKSVSYAGMPVATDCYKAGWHRLPVATDSMPRRRARPRRSAPSLAVSTLVRTAIQVTLVSSVFRCASASGRETTRKHAVASSTKPSVPRSRYATTHRPARPHPPQHFTNAHVVGSLDSAAMVNIFTSDARILPPNADPVIGRPAIEPHVSDVDAPPFPRPRPTVERPADPRPVHGVAGREARRRDHRQRRPQAEGDGGRLGARVQAHSRGTSWSASATATGKIND